MLQELLTIFFINFLTSIDNTIVLAGIAKKYKNLLLLGLISSIILTICRTSLIMGVVSVSKWPGFRMALGIGVLIVAINLANARPGEERDEYGFWKVLLVLVTTDLALSVDNVMSISIVSRNPFLIAISVLLSLLPLFMLLPAMVKVMDMLAWLRILAAGFVAELSIDSITDDPLISHQVPKGTMEAIVRLSFASLIILYGFWRTYLQKPKVNS